MVRTEEGFGERGLRFPRKETIADIYSRVVSSGRRLDEVLDEDFPWCADHGDDLRRVFAAYTDGSTEMMNERIGAGLLKAHGPAA